MIISGLSPDLVLTHFRVVLDLGQNNVLFPAAMSGEGHKSIQGGIEHPIHPMCLRFICSLRGPHGEIN